jgi:hypothetical protein
MLNFKKVITAVFMLSSTAAMAQNPSMPIVSDGKTATPVNAAIKPVVTNGTPTPDAFSGCNTFDGQGVGTTGTNIANFGCNAGRVNTSDGLVSIGSNAGYSNTTGSQNLYVGYQAGYNNTTGALNAFVGFQSGVGNNSNWGAFLGYQSGYSNTSGTQNTFLGSLAGYQNTVGSNNTAVGHFSGGYNNTGTQNTSLGAYAGLQTKGSNNTMLGYATGFTNTNGFGNVFIGSNVGYNETGSNKLYIDNSSTATPLIKGDFGTRQLNFNGKTSIGTANQPISVGGANTSAYFLFVKGGILSDEVRVRTGWADYVFDKKYTLLPLQEVEAFINTNKHLPNMPAATQVENDGLNLGDMSRLQQEKIEELTLYLIAQDKQLKAQQQEINVLKATVKELLKK